MVGCQTTQPEKKENDVYRGASFEMMVLPTIEVANEQGEDYAVHYFRIMGSKTTMGVYEGQHPNLFAKKEKDLTPMRKGTTFRENIERGDDVWGVDSNAKIWRESVWSTIRVVTSAEKKVYRLPSMLHIWYFGATDEEQETLDSLVNPIQMKK